MFHVAIREYGVSAFEHCVLEEHPDARSAYKAENRINKELRAQGRKLYNENNGGLGGPDPTPELRARISASVKEALKNADMSFYKTPEYRETLSKAITMSYTDELRLRRVADTNAQWEHWREQQAMISPQRGYEVYKGAGDRARRRGDISKATELYARAKQFQEMI